MAGPMTKREFAYEQIRQQIMDGTLRPGERLSLRPLADQLDVSVMPVRDALRALEADGLVTASNHRGAHVSAISREEILSVISLRAWIEILAMREATPRHNTETLEAVAAALTACEKALKAGSGARFTKANRQFHQAAEAPANEITRSCIEDLWNRLWQVRREESLFVLDPGYMTVAQQHHEMLYAALEKSDVDKVVTAMTKHRESNIAAWERALNSVHSE
jgi:DNA-binding GntR family transcriptional regulator